MRKYNIIYMFICVSSLHFDKNFSMYKCEFKAQPSK